MINPKENCPRASEGRAFLSRGIVSVGILSGLLGYVMLGLRNWNDLGYCSPGIVHIQKARLGSGAQKPMMVG